jgi:hypothetical protein
MDFLASIYAQDMALIEKLVTFALYRFNRFRRHQYRQLLVDEFKVNIDQQLSKKFGG